MIDIKTTLKIAAVLILGLSLAVTYFILGFTDETMFDRLMGIFDGYADGIVMLLIVFVVSFIVISGLIYFLAIKFFNYDLLSSKSRKLGTSKFATLRDLENVRGNDGLILGKKVRLSKKHSFSHHCLVGVTGSGKSSAYFIPNLVSNPEASFIVTDPKGELFELTARENLKQGKRVLVFSPFGEDTLKYNPLSLCDNYTEVVELAQSLLANGNASVEAITGQKSGGAEWIGMSTPLLAAFLIYVRTLQPPKNTISYALDLILENELDDLKFIIEDTDEVAERYFNTFLQSSGSEETLSSIKTVLSSNLQSFNDPMIVNLTSENEINPKMLRDRPTVLYVVVPEQRSDYMAPIMASFFSQMIGKLMEHKGAPVYAFLDEFANIGVIGGIDKYLAVVRSREISISIGIQSLNQLSQKYGKDASITILDNLKTKTILPGSSYETADYFSKLIGGEEVETTSKSYSRDRRDKSFSDSKQTRELLSADEIRRLGDGKILIVTDNKNPFIDDQERYYEKEEYLKKTSQKMDISEYVKEFRKRISQR